MPISRFRRKKQLPIDLSPFRYDTYRESDADPSGQPCKVRNVVKTVKFTEKTVYLAPNVGEWVDWTH
jgi:hypothetical protein